MLYMKQNSRAVHVPLHELRSASRVAMLLRLLARPQLRIPRLTSARRLSTAIDPELYHNVCERTLEALQDVYEEYADADPALLMDVEYAVCENPLASMHAVPHALLHHIVRASDTVGGPVLVAQDGVLNVIVGTQGTFVLNKQAPNLQLWLSSPISGPLRYDFSVQDAAWLNVRDGHSLLKLLADDFEKLTKKPLRLEAVAVAVRVAAVE